MGNHNDTPELSGLQIDKLKEEIAQLKRPFWRQYAFYTALFPIVVASLAVATGFYTGYFDAVKERNAYESEKLADKTKLLETREAELTVESSKLSFEVTQYEKDKAKLSEETAKLQSTIEAQKRELATQNDLLTKQIRQKEEQLMVAEKQVADPQFYLLVHQLTTDQFATNSAFNKLVDLLRGDSDHYLPLIRKEITDEDPKKSAVLLLVQYNALNDTTAKDELLQFAKNVDPKIESGFWDVFEYAPWRQDELPGIWEILVDRVVKDKIPDASANSIFGLFDLKSREAGVQDKAIDDFVVNNFENKQSFFTGYMAISAMLNDKDNAFRFGGPLGALAWLEPRSYLVNVANILVNMKLDQPQKEYIRGILSEHAVNGLKEIIKEVNFPEDESQYGAWLKANKDLVSFWLDPSLSKARGSYPSKVR